MTQTLQLVKQDLEKHKGGLATLLQGSINPERFMNLVVRACKTTPKLLACDRASFFLAVSKAAELGLEPNTALGHGWLLPYGNQVQFIAGYKGFIELAARTAKIKIWARVVYEGDTFRWIEGTEPKIVHEPKMGETTNEKITHAYAVAKFPDGELQFEVLRKEEIEAIRNRSQSAKSSHSPWFTDYPAMCKKTAIRRLANVLPMRHEKWAQLVDLDNEDYMNGGPITVQAEAPTPQGEPKRRGRKPKNAASEPENRGSEPDLNPPFPGNPMEMTPEEKRDFLPIGKAKIINQFARKDPEEPDPGYIREPGEEG